MKFLFLSAMALAYTHKDFPYSLDKIPKKKPCNQIEFFKECKDLSHYRGKDYVVFRWHDEATDCAYDDGESPTCVSVGESWRIRIRNGCLISWCKRKSPKSNIPLQSDHGGEKSGK